MVPPTCKISNTLPVQLANLGILAERRLAAVLEPYRLVPSEFRVLGALIEIGPCTASEIAALVPIDASFISRVVQRLAGKRLLTRRRSQRDRRTVVLYVSDNGRALMTELVRPLQNLEDGFVRDVPPRNLDSIRGAMESLLASLNSQDGP